MSTCNVSTFLKIAAHTSLLLLLFSQDRAYEIVEDMDANKVRKMKKRICLVLDCLCAHDFSDKTADLINLQHYVIKEKRLSEREAIVIFYDVVRVVEALHKVSRQWNWVFFINDESFNTTMLLSAVGESVLLLSSS